MRRQGLGHAYHWVISRTTGKPITHIVRDEFRNPLYWLFAGVAWRWVPDAHYWWVFGAGLLFMTLGHIWWGYNK